jgi:hypothetical protein
MRTAAILFGILLLVIGTLGFIPTDTPEGVLLGAFHVNTAHNIVHLISGVAALLCGFGTTAATRLFFRIFGVAYGLLTVLGVVQGEGPTPHLWLHFGIAVTLLLLGFAPARRRVHARA